MNTTAHCRSVKSCKGFTLVEVMISAALGITVITLAMTTFLNLSFASASGITNTMINRNLRYALNVSSRDLSSAYQILAYAPSSYVYFSRKTATGDANNFLYMSGTTFRRWQDGSSLELASGIDSVVFTLYDEDGNITTAPSEAKAVNVALSAEASNFRQSFDDEMQVRVFLRNK